MARKIWLVARIVMFISVLLILWNLLWIYNFHSRDSAEVALPTPVSKLANPIVPSSRPPKQIPRAINIAVVVCGDRVNETLVLMKSALIFSHTFIRFIIFADDEATVSIDERVGKWPSEVLDRMKLDIRPITFPAGKEEEWKKLFKPCASQRLFLPSLLLDVDSLLYMDTDTLFLTSPDKVWEHFSLMNDSQMAAVAPEHEDHATGWYNRFARHPYYGALGVNSGVMLMNLTRMRHFQWEKYVIPVYQEYKTKITWGDQDIINIVFHFHPEKLYVYPCHYNYRPDHCMYMSVCKPAEKDGVYVLHGNRGSFHSKKQIAFRAIYSVFEQYAFGSDMKENLLERLEEELQSTQNTNCGKMMNVFTTAIKHHIST